MSDEKTVKQPRRPVYALHSSASSGSQWREMIRHFADDFRCEAPDLPGYGNRKSGYDSSRSGVASLATPIIELIERERQDVHLVGHSNGAAVALKIALERPDIVRSLSLYEPATFQFLRQGDFSERKMFRQISRLAGMVNVSLAFGNPQAGMEAFIDFWNGPGAWNAFSEETRTKFATMAGSIVCDFHSGFAEGWNLDELKRIKVPTLVMSGDRSPPIARKIACEIAGAIGDSRFIRFPELGHMAPVYNALDINMAVHAHITKVDRRLSVCRNGNRMAA
jgi:pimeloyl-ACP methyl ester carboxylesterase